MTFWSGETIDIYASRPNSDFIIPYFKDRIDCASYKLSMGNEVYVTENDGLFPPYADKKTLAEKESFWIPPGQFAFLLSKEFLNIPKGVLGFISLKTSKKYQGLVNVSGFHVDPGFQGQLIFAVYNAGSKKVRLVQGERLFLIWFSDLDNQETKNNRIDNQELPQTEIGSKLIEDMRGPPVSVQSLSEELASLKFKFNIIISVLSVLGSILVLVLAALAVPWAHVISSIRGIFTSLNGFTAS